MSQYIHAYQLNSMVRKSLKGFTIIDNSTGEIYEGNNLNTDRLTPLHVKIAGKKDNNFDAGGIFEGLQSVSWVNSPSPAFKNWWEDKACKKRKDKGEKFSSLWNGLVLATGYNGLEFATEIVQGSNYQYISCRIKGKKGITAFYNKSGKLRFFRLADGTEIQA